MNIHMDEDLRKAICGIEEDETYSLTPWGCLYSVLQDYGINLGVSGRVGAQIVEDFMDLMVKQDYVRVVEDNK